MKLAEILDNTGVSSCCDIVINDIIFDTRTFDKFNFFGDKLFVCISGFIHDGHDYVSRAYEMGVRIFAVEKEVSLPGDAVILKVESTRIFLALASANLFKNPSINLLTIGITGTKGKTSTSYMIKNILEEAGIKTGLIGTVGVMFGEKTIWGERSTPESYFIHKYFKEMIDCGCKAVVMETSSQGFKLFRTHGIYFDIGVFTNLSNDHISDNEHKDFNEYMNCKKMLFNQCKKGIFNGDDFYFDIISKNIQCDKISFGFNSKNVYCGKNIEFLSGINGLSTRYDMILNKKNLKLDLPLLGNVSVYNSLCAATIADVIGIESDCIIKGLKKTTVRGRGELLPVNKNYNVVIDFAHNEVSINSIFQTLKPYKKARIITVFGCGGNRVRERRYIMGDIITKNSEIAIITSDNPRFEKLDDIIKDIYSGIKKPLGDVFTIKDRRQAIYYALDIAQTGDIVLIVGKGHQDYEEIEGKFYDFDERKIVMEKLNS